MLKDPEHCPTIFTSDVSADMVADALKQNLPAIRQPAQHLMFHENSVDGVIFAYGTHHIPVNDRPLAVAEAYRILRPNNYIVMQDFETGTPTARWYQEVLHKYTFTGHAFEHFTRDNMYDLLKTGGFVDVRVVDVYDPCIVYGETPEQAKINLLSFLVHLFSLNKLLPSNGNAHRNFWPEIEEVVAPYATFRAERLPKDAPAVPRITVTRENGRYRAEMPRVALVGIGLKP
jgi:SAM-dependent methyltransferase